MSIRNLVLLFILPNKQNHIFSTRIKLIIEFKVYNVSMLKVCEEKHFNISYKLLNINTF